MSRRRRTSARSASPRLSSLRRMPTAFEASRSRASARLAQLVARPSTTASSGNPARIRSYQPASWLVVSSAAAVDKTRSAKSAGPSTVVTRKCSRSISAYPPSAAMPAVSRPGSRSPVCAGPYGSDGTCRGSSSRHAMPCRPPGTPNGTGGGSLDGLASSSSRPDRYTQTPVMSGIGCPAATRPEPSPLSAARSAVGGCGSRPGRSAAPGCGSALTPSYRNDPGPVSSPASNSVPPPVSNSVPSSGYSSPLAGLNSGSGSGPAYRGSGPGRAAYDCSAARSRCSAAITGALAGTGIRLPKRRAWRWRRRIRASATLTPPTSTPAPNTANGEIWASSAGRAKPASWREGAAACAGAGDAAGAGEAAGGSAAGVAAAPAGLEAGTVAAGCGWLKPGSRE